MGVYNCTFCGEFRDSDDGCHENPEGEGLICPDCFNNWLDDLPNCPICKMGPLYQEGSISLRTKFFCDNCDIAIEVSGDEIQATKKLKQLLKFSGKSKKTEDDAEADFIESQERYYK